MLAPHRTLAIALALGVGLARAADTRYEPAEPKPAAAPALEQAPAASPQEVQGPAEPERAPAEGAQEGQKATEPGQAPPAGAQEEQKPREPAAPPPASAQEQKPGEPGRTPAAGAQEQKRNEPQPPEGDTWIDVGHAFIEQRIFAPVLRLDRFFSDERDLDAERSRSFIRWRNEVHFTEDHSGPIFATGLRANLRLPGLNQQLRRLRVVISSDTRDALQTLFPRQQGTSVTEDQETVGPGNAGLRLYFLDTLISHADLGAGILTRLPPGAYGQLRFRTAVPTGKLFLTRSVLTGFWRTDTRFGTAGGLEFERPLPRSVVARLNGAATLTEVSKGVEWNSELAFLTTIDPHTAGVLALSVNGVTRPPLASDGMTRLPDLDRFRLYTRARRDVFRRWIFFEVEPELAWTWTLERGRHPAWGVTFRAEFQFQGNEAPPPPPPEPPPEPKDPAPVDALPIRPSPR